MHWELGNETGTRLSELTWHSWCELTLQLWKHMKKTWLMQVVPLILGTVEVVGYFNNFQDKWSNAEGISSQSMSQSHSKVSWRTACRRMQCMWKDASFFFALGRGPSIFCCGDSRIIQIVPVDPMGTSKSIFSGQEWNWALPVLGISFRCARYI